METTTVNNPNMLIALKAQEIVQSAQTKDGWMTKEEHDRINAELRKLGINVITSTEHEDEPATDEHGRTFFEVSIHPFAVQIVDEDGDPIDEDDQWSFNPSGSEWSGEYGDDLDGYPDEMFLKGWSVSSWVGTPIFDEEGDLELHEDIDEVDDEDFPDYDTAIARAEELAKKYRVDIDHRY